MEQFSFKFGVVFFFLLLRLPMYFPLMELILTYRELDVTPTHIAKCHFINNGRVDRQKREVGTKMFHI